MEVAAFIWLFILLKVPVIAALLLIWWAIREPAPDDAEEDADGEDDGGSRLDREHGPRRPWPRRRGPHGGAPLASPPRSRGPASRPARTPR